MGPEVLAVVVGVVGAIIGSSLTAGVFMQRIRNLENRDDIRTQSTNRWRDQTQRELDKTKDRLRETELWAASHKTQCEVKRDR